MKLTVTIVVNLDIIFTATGYILLAENLTQLQDMGVKLFSTKFMGQNRNRKSKSVR